jgi:hypothetical protein
MKRGFKLFLLCSLFFIFLWGCGGSDSAPPNSVITINPDEVTVTDSTGEPKWNTQFYTISLKDENGDPLGDTRIAISFIWAVPNIVGVVQLYDGDTPVNSPFYADTDDFGTYILRVDFQSGGISYFGDIEVRSGDAFGSAGLTVES